MDDRIFQETEKVVHRMHVPRNAYINEAVDFYNRRQKRQVIRKQLGRDVRNLKKQTRETIKSFELLEDLPG